MEGRNFKIVFFGERRFFRIGGGRRIRGRFSFEVKLIKGMENDRLGENIGCTLVFFRWEN